MDDLDRTDALRAAGARGLAAYNARISYGRPLHEAEAIAFFDWFGACEIFRREER